MSNTIFNNHPLIKNSNQYFLEKKFISIHSDDRDMFKYPNSSEFEITLPQEYLNIASARLYSWSFPSNYNVFSITNTNVYMTFKFTELYNPGDHSVSNILLEGIFAALYNYTNTNNNFIIEIEPGFYNPEQMAIELTNKMNETVTNTIIHFLNSPEGAPYAAAEPLFKQYDRFRVPFYLGFTRCNAASFAGDEFVNTFTQDFKTSTAIASNDIVPRFYYGDAVTGSGDNGYWLLPNLPEAKVYFLQAPLKIAFMGPAYIYMEIEGMNCIDESIPYTLNTYTVTNSSNNGIVNSAFAKIPVPTTPISQWFDDSMGPYKYWNPPAERISKLKLKFRYHNGTLVQFGNFEYSFMLEFNLLRPQQERSYSIVDAFDLSQHQSFGSKFF